MRKFSQVLFIAFLPVLLFAQNTISGTVTNASTGEALPGANVVVLGTNMGAAATVDGSYTISNVPDGTFTITELAREILWNSKIPIWGKILRLLQIKSCNQNQIIEILGIDEIFLEDFPDNTMDSVPLISIINKIESVVNSVKPSVVFTHHSGDMNIDHQLTHKAVMTACRPTPELSVKEIYTFEVISSTDWGFDDNKFTPNFFVK